jgi:predicted nucleotidyltransferase
VVDILRDVLGDAVVGAYLHGSAVLSGLRPTSDLDVLGVVARETTDAERRAIVERLLEISGRRAYRGPARPLELTVVRASELRPWRPVPTVDLLYGEWLRDAFETGDVPAPTPMPDLGPEVALALQGDAALFGPPAAEVFEPVPRADLARSVMAGVPGLVSELETDTRNVVLTLARIWYTLETGIIGSKDEAAAWALERLPAGSREVLALARDEYLDGRDDTDWAARMAAVRADAAHIVDRMASQAPPAS